MPTMTPPHGRAYFPQATESGELQRELLSVADTLQSPYVQGLWFAKLYAAPANPWDGLVVYADGTTWNPGAGEGLYVYHGGAWNFIA